MSTPPLRIAIDMDEVMADALTEHLRRYNAAFGRHLSAPTTCVAVISRIAFRRRSATPPRPCSTPPFSRARRAARLPGSRWRAGGAPRGVHRVRRHGRALFLRREIPLAAPALPVHPAVAYRLLRRQEHRRRRLSDRRPGAAFHPVQGTRPMLFSAPHNAGETAYPRVASWKDVQDHFAQLGAHF